jgi:D-3-phosphoglycerate dehydrogenase
MRILIADKFPEKYVEKLKEICSSVEFAPDTSAEDLKSRAANINILVVRSTEVRAAAIENARQLNLIIRAGAGYNTIDVDVASERGIYVANCPGKNSVAVAELAIGLILSIDRRIPDNVAELKTKKWNKKEYGKADGIMGKTLGIVGLGQIGQAVLERARGFGLKCIGWSRSLTPERAHELRIGYCASVEDVVKQSDIITLHVAHTPETKHLINKKMFDLMKPGTILINAARGGIVDEKALIGAIQQKGIRAGLDVYEHEPKPSTADFDDPVTQQVWGTHHIGASTSQAQNAIAEETVRIVRDFVEKGEVHNCVNLAKKTPAKWQLNVRHYDKVGVLANVLAIIKRHNINIQDMVNTIFEGAKAAVCKMKLDSEPVDAVISEIEANKDEIINVEKIAIG